MWKRIGKMLGFLLLFLLSCQRVEAQSADTVARPAHQVYLPAVLFSAAPSVAQPVAMPGENENGTERALVVRIYFSSREALPALVERLDVFEEPTTNGYAVALVSEPELAQLRSAGVRVAVDEQRTARLLASMAQVTSAALANTQAATTIPGYACYRTVEETHQRLLALTIDYPHLATRVDIGDSWEKVQSAGAAGYDLFALVLTNRTIPGPKPKFLLMGAIHAREYATAELATRFAEALLTNYNSDPDVTWLLDYFEIHIIPQANPDGRKLAEAGDLWRKNTDADDGCTFASFWGTDLNRNSSFKWGWPGAGTDACDTTYRGPSAASEPEVQAIQTYAALFADQRGPQDSDAAPVTAEGIFISLHSYGELVLYPWGWTTAAAPNMVELRTLGRKFGYFTGYQVCTAPNCLYSVSGVTDDYTYGELGVASFTFEIGQDFFEQCSTFTGTIIPQTLPALTYAAKAARRPYQNPAGPDVYHFTVTPATVTAGATITLTATADDTRYASRGQGDEPTQAVQAARYSIDKPSWAGGVTFAMSATDGAFTTALEAVNATVATTGLAPGRHTIFVEAQDLHGNWGVVTAQFFTVTTGNTTQVFSNHNPLTIPTRGKGAPYPSVITVAGVSGALGKVTVTLRGLTHSYPDDLDLLLVSPTGGKVLLLSDAGGSTAVSNLTLTFDSAAATRLPNASPLVAGTYAPTNYGASDPFAAPAPARPYSSALTTFAGTNPNGAWKLYLVDDATRHGGALSGGWALTITPAATGTVTGQPVTAANDDLAPEPVEADSDTKREEP